MEHDNLGIAGVLVMDGTPILTSEENARFWAKVRKSPECWWWEGGVSSCGYGQFWVSKKMKSVHRISWMLANGSIPDGLSVLHKCDNKLCIRPDHLFLGTALDNMRDMHRKQRNNRPRGEQHRWAKLTDDQVESIRKLKTRGVSSNELSQLFGVTNIYINALVRNAYRARR